MRPLEGIKVVELGTHVAVPAAARLFADWGAQVIKVESPTGDLWRQFGVNCNAPTTDEENPVFSIPNSNKEIIALNLKSEEGKAVLLRLLEDADVFMTNVRGDALRRLGLDYDRLKDAFPRLVYFHFTAYGTEGPQASMPGFDVAAFWAAGGGMADWPSVEGATMAPGSAFGDTSVSATVASGILAALLGAQRTGKGRFLTTSLYAASLWYNHADIICRQPQYNKPRHVIPGHTSNPFSRTYVCKGGARVLLGGINFRIAWPKGLKVLGLEEYLDDPRYNTQQAFWENGQPVTERCEALFLTKTAEEWVELFLAADVVAQKVVSAGEIPDSVQAWVNGYLTEVDYPTTGNKTVLPNTPVKFEGAEPAFTGAVGGIGCNSRAVLRRCGYSEEEIALLERSGAVVSGDE